MREVIIFEKYKLTENGEVININSQKSLKIEEKSNGRFVKLTLEGKTKRININPLIEENFPPIVEEEKIVKTKYRKLRGLVKVSMSKSVFEDQFGDQQRTLTYTWDFKNEELADLIIDKMDEKFEENGYDWRFARCPWTDEGSKYEYGDSIDIPFEQGSMSEIKSEMTRIWNEVKNEIESL